MGHVIEGGSGKYTDCHSEQTPDLKSTRRHGAPRRAHPESDILLPLSRSEQYKESCYTRRSASYCAGVQIPTAGASLQS